MTTCNNHGNEATGKMNATNNNANATNEATTGNPEPCIVRQVCDAMEYPTCPFVGNCHHEGDDVKLATMIVQVPYSSCVGGFGMEWQEDEVSEQAGAGIDTGMDTTATKPTANATMHDDLQALIAELKEANALFAIDIRRAASEAAAARVGTSSEANTATGTEANDTAKNTGKHRKAKQPKPITDEDRRMIDDWLEQLFDAPANVHAMVLVQMPKTKRVYRLLHDAELRNNWRASAIHLELTRPDRWAPQVENIIYTDAEHSEKKFRKTGRAGRYNGKAK